MPKYLKLFSERVSNQSWNWEKIKEWGVILFGVSIAAYVGHHVASGDFSARLPFAMVFGFLFLMAAWKWGPIVVLMPAAAFVWLQQQFLNYFFLNPILFDAPVAEISVYLATLLYLGKKGRFSFQKVPYVPLLIIFASFGITLFFLGSAQNHKTSWLALRWCVLGPSLAYLIVGSVLRDAKDIEKFVASFLIGSVVLSVISILAYRGHIEMAPWGGYQTGAVNRLAAPYDVPLFGYMVLGGNITVVFSSFALPLAFSLWLHARGERWKRALAMGVLVVNFIALIISASRSVWIGTSMACILIIILIDTENRLNLFVRTMLVLSFFVGAFIVLDQQGYISGEISHRISSLSQGFAAPAEYWNETGGGRPLAWKEIVPVMLDSPLGTGFIESFAEVGGPDQGPHSQYLFLLLGTGIVGTASFLLFLTLCLKRCMRYYKLMNTPSRWVVLGVAGAVLSYFFDAFMVHTFLVPGGDLAIFMLCGAGVATINLSRIEMSNKGKVSVGGRRISNAARSEHPGTKWTRIRK